MAAAKGAAKERLATTRPCGRGWSLRRSLTLTQTRRMVMGPYPYPNSSLTVTLARSVMSWKHLSVDSTGKSTSYLEEPEGRPGVFNRVVGLALDVAAEDATRQETQGELAKPREAPEVERVADLGGEG